MPRLPRPYRFLIPAIGFATLGLATSFDKWPDLRPAQVFLPFGSGIATGLVLGRFIRELRLARATNEIGATP